MIQSDSLILEARDLSLTFPHSTFRVGPINLGCASGSHTTILGKNGSGKSTLLSLLAGLQKPTEGRVLLNGVDVSSVPTRKRAQSIAMLVDLKQPPAGLTVQQLVMMGRYPHQTWVPFDSETDVACVERALSWTDTTSFRHRFIQELSLGERQRVLLARAMAQEPTVLLLDEPSSHLDIARQLELEDQLARMREELGIAVVAVSHDYNISTRHADFVLMLQDGMAVVAGTPDAVLTESALSDVYDAPLIAMRHPKSDRPWFAPRGLFGP
jgi:iron complex transport system ATP-binding protein